MRMASTGSNVRRYTGFGLFALCVLAAVLLGDGRAGGDEGRILEQVRLLSSHHGRWHDFLGEARANPYWIAHQPLWFLITGVQIAFVRGVEMLLNFRPLPMAEGFLVSLTQVAAALCAMALSYAYVRDRHADKNLAIATVAAVWLGSSALCLLTGGFMESTLALLVVGRLWIARPGVAMTPRLFVHVAMLDLLMILAKPYALLYCLVSLPLLLRRAAPKACCAWTYGAIVAAFTLGALAIKQACSGIYLHDMLALAGSGGSPWLARVVRIGYQLVSFPYGILWCFPAVAVLPFCPRPSRTGLLVTAGAVLSLVVFFASFEFWHGGNGIAGPRYILPFLLGFLPYVAEGIAGLRARAPLALYAIPALVLLFLPALNYRHNLVLNLPERSDLSLPGEPALASYYAERGAQAAPVPLYDALYQPGLFAWRIEAAKRAGADTVALRLSPDRALTIATRHIFPQTGIARLYYALARRPLVEGQAPDFRGALPAWMLAIPGALAALLVLAGLWRIARAVHVLAVDGVHPPSGGPA